MSLERLSDVATVKLIISEILRSCEIKYFSKSMQLGFCDFLTGLSSQIDPRLRAISYCQKHEDNNVKFLGTISIHTHQLRIFQNMFNCTFRSQLFSQLFIGCWRGFVWKTVHSTATDAIHVIIPGMGKTITYLDAVRFCLCLLSVCSSLCADWLC